MVQLDVAIVGGGPGGLAAACSILKTSPNLKVRVFERAKELRVVGFTLGMIDNGFNALEAIDEELASNVIRHMLQDGAVSNHDINGELVRSFPSVAAMGFSDTARVGHLPWYELQAELADWLPKGSLVLDSSFSSLEQDSSGVHLKFQNSTGEEDTYTAKVVIGADGNQSNVRECVLKDGPPNFLNTVVWRGQTSTPDDWPHDDNLLTGWGHEGKLFLAVKMVNKLAWQAYAPLAAEDLKTLSTGRYVDTGVMTKQPGVDKLQRAAEEYATWPSIVRDLIASTRPETVTEHGQFFREVSECSKWGEGRVTLMGDAAHLMTPFLGQGVNQTLVDAVEIGRCIGEHGPQEKALRAYEETRIGPALIVQDGSVSIAKNIFAGKPNTEIQWMKEHPELIRHRPRKLSTHMKARGANRTPQMRITNALLRVGGMQKLLR